MRTIFKLFSFPCLSPKFEALLENKDTRVESCIYSLKMQKNGSKTLWILWGIYLLVYFIISIVIINIMKPFVIFIFSIKLKLYCAGIFSDLFPGFVLALLNIPIFNLLRNALLHLKIKNKIKKNEDRRESGEPKEAGAD